MKHRLPAIALAALVATAPFTHADAATRRTSSERNESWGSRSLPSKARSEVSKLSRQDALEVIPMPILLGVGIGDFGDTWGEARSDGRTHEGTDILAPKGAYVVAPTRSVVSDIGVGANGGNFVYTINPGGERYYFAHLDRYAEDLEVGDILEEGDLIGYVGNTGNASGGPAHLHFGIYAGGAQNPFGRLTRTLTTSTRVEAIGRIIKDSDDEAADARMLASLDAPFLRAADLAGNDLPTEVREALKAVIPVVASPAGGAIGVRDLTLGSQGADVTRLQKALIAQAKGPAATALASAGATGYFGAMTQAALAEWQRATGVAPAAGYFGPLTRTRLTSLGLI